MNKPLFNIIQFLKVGWIKELFLCVREFSSTGLLLSNGTAREPEDWAKKGKRNHPQSLQSCPTLRDTMDCSPPGSSVHGILQARIPDWVAIPAPENVPGQEFEPMSLVSPALAGRFFYH